MIKGEGSGRVPFGGAYYGILNVEGDDAAPHEIFRSRDAAERYMEYCRTLPEDDDDHLTVYYNVLVVHVAGALWNWFDPDPREGDPLSAEEILTVHEDRFGAPKAPASAERWAKVEVVGHRSHVGRVSEELVLDTPFLRVEALRVDGGYDVVSYGRAAIFSVSPRTEAEARREAVPLAWRPCVLEGGGHDFAPSGALPSACAHCGYDLPEHDKAREKRGAPCSLEDDAPDSDDEIPFPEAKR